MKKRIVIFASGGGTNTQNVIKYFQHKEVAEVICVLSNKKDAKVIARANALQIKTIIFSKAEILNPERVLVTLKSLNLDLIVLAGFLLKFPKQIIEAFPNKVINIHPALLPKYGGKGMYGHHVHEAVIANKETETGITIHFVNENYDEGAIIFQAATPVTFLDSAEDVASMVHELEYEWLPKIIEELLTEE